MQGKGILFTTWGMMTLPRTRGWMFGGDLMLTVTTPSCYNRAAPCRVLVAGRTPRVAGKVA